MIRKNEKLGARPFFDRVELEPAEQITGIVKRPDGESVANMPVLAFSMADPKHLSEEGLSFARGKTNNDGRFRLNVIKGGRAVLWLLPAHYAQQTQVVGDRRGNLGTFTLENGTRLKGRVINRDGAPIAGIWVNAELVEGPAEQPIGMSVSDSIERSALTDANGAFELAPLPASTYRVLPGENPRENPNHDRKRRSLPAVFLPKRVSIATGQSPEPLTIQAVETVTIEAQIYDSAGKPRSGHEVEFFGRNGDASDEYYFSEGRPDANGHILLEVPKGLHRAETTLSSNEHQVLRYRWSSKGDLRAVRKIEFATLDRDYRGIEIYYYTAPILIVGARDGNGIRIPDFKPAIYYRASVKPREAGSGWISGVEGEVNFEKQDDGRWRSDQLLPVEEFILTVIADGYQPTTKVTSLKEGEIKELAVELAKSDHKSN